MRLALGLVARELGHVTLSQLAFDGTRMRANSRRSGTRTVADLQTARAALAAKFQELQAKAEAQDAAVCASALIGHGVFLPPLPTGDVAC